MDKLLNVGLDIGSTTVKIAVVDSEGHVVFKSYRRHFADIKNTVKDMLLEAKGTLQNACIKVMVTGSGGLELANRLKVTFVQEVIACSKAINRLIPSTDVAIELGGEDAKITYLKGAVEQRMNSTCAGGTGAFIDQMATLLKTDAKGLNDLAEQYETMYPIASRCGVFAKTDIQPLMNEGVNKEDIAASIFQSVINQSISGLAQGRAIKGRVAFLGGPLHYLPQLRNQFIDTLKLSDSHVIIPENSQYFVAIGAAFTAEDEIEVQPECLYKNLNSMNFCIDDDKVDFKPLFKDEEDYKQFLDRHNKHSIVFEDIENYEGNAFLGIDAGSTTSKIVLISSDGEILYSMYMGNMGDPLEVTKRGLMDLYNKLGDKIAIVKTAVTGYGEELLKNAFKVDIGEIETIAHYKAAKYFNPEVDFILDIGGQDMKCIKLKDGVIESVLLNEACSSGCGSFIETFANSLNIEIKEFAKRALFAKAPVDLGTRCTVFMNSKVKEAQKNGRDINDIAAGISISVIKNALNKVIRVKNPEEIGKNIVVQGGTFYNNAVLRAFEQQLKVEVIRPNIAGLMGAYGVALIAMESYKTGDVSTFIDEKNLVNFDYNTESKRCDLCTNNCLISIKKFSDGRKFFSGNRCERGEGLPIKKNIIPNLYEYKLKRVFAYKSISKDKAYRGTIGLPRVLNMYEDYPLWHRFFTELGFRVVLSKKSTTDTYLRGIETIPSESVCYPAKLIHGHIIQLIEDGCDTIFYPSIPFNYKEDKGANNHYNCPVVSSYPEVIEGNIDALRDSNIRFHHPFIRIDHKGVMAKQLYEEFKEYGITKEEIAISLLEGLKELVKYKDDIREEGQRALKYMQENNMKGIVLVGRPYHIDPEINHGIPEIINSYGFVVLSEDSIMHLAEIKRPLRAIDQWVYHSRLYRAATLISERKDLELIQLNSFGCGLDAITTDQIQEILEAKGRIYTVIKIDEINNTGAAKIRIRSLISAIKERENNPNRIREKNLYMDNKVFTKEMKKNHKIICPQMSPIHFQFLDNAFKKAGYDIEVLPSVDNKAIESGLRFVNNDACYPAIIVIGQMINALESGRYDIKNTSLVISQTGGGCRATNYIALLRKALKDAGYPDIPVISLNTVGLEKNPGFKLTIPLMHSVLKAMVYGDLLMKVLYRTRPYEVKIGEADRLAEKWGKICNDEIINTSLNSFKNNIKGIVSDFENIKLNKMKKPRVGVVGEILVKFHPVANNDIVSIIEKEGGEAVVPSLLDFGLYSAYNSEIRFKEFGGSKTSKYICNTAIGIIEMYRNVVRKELKNSKRFDQYKYIDQVAKAAKKHVSLMNQMGEGWLLTGEMVELIEEKVENILCLQPFACLPNHITGKGVIKKLRTAYNNANIVAIDYDPGASKTNQLNRIKLMLSVAKQNII